MVEDWYPNEPYARLFRADLTGAVRLVNVVPPGTEDLSHLKQFDIRVPRSLTEREVAELLGVSVATLRAWRHRGKGPRFPRLGRSVRYLPTDAADFVRASAVDTAPVSSSDEDSELGELRV